MEIAKEEVNECCMRFQEQKCSWENRGLNA